MEICSVQLPGRENRLREKPFTRLTSLVETLAGVLKPYIKIPFAFFGHSVGALISFELAREIRRQNCFGPIHLFVSGRRAPQLPDPDPPIHRLPEAAFVDELKRLNGTPDAVLQNSELMELFLPVLRADFAILETYDYVPEVPLNCSITAFGGFHDFKANAKELAAWRDQTSGNFTLEMFPGGHFFFQKSKSLFLEKMSQDLTTSLGRI